jgi:chemotaxis family two-component system response regulator Rcp1
MIDETPKLIDILLVEDNPADVLLTKNALEQEQVCNHIGVAKDGVEALQYLRCEGEFADARRPDLILLDLNMPRMDGQEFLNELKADENLRCIPVVVLTSSDADEDIHRSYDLQAAGYIKKPASLAQLVEIVKNLKKYWVGIVKLPPS